MHWLLAIFCYLWKLLGGDDRTSIRLMARKDGRVMQVPRRSPFHEMLRRGLGRWWAKISWMTDAVSRSKRGPRKGDRYCIDLGLNRWPNPPERD